MIFQNFRESGRVLDITKLLRNAERLEKSKFTYVNCFITGLLFTTKDVKKNKVQVPQRNEMLSLYCTILGFISKNEEYKLESNM